MSGAFLGINRLGFNVEIFIPIPGSRVLQLLLFDTQIVTLTQKTPSRGNIPDIPAVWKLIFPLKTKIPETLWLFLG